MSDPAWHVVGASAAGTMHRARNIECQDAFGYHTLDDGTLVIALADGAGSAERAAEGARGAVEAALAHLIADLNAQRPADRAEWERAMIGAFNAARERLTQRATEANLALRAFATTLACAVIVDARAIVAQLGDGAAVAQDTEGDYFLVATPQRGEYANEAYLLSMPTALDHITITMSSRVIRALAITTDGLLRLALQLPGYTPFSKFFDPLFAFAAETVEPEKAHSELAAFLDSDRVCARTDDDKTIVLVTHPAATP